MTKATQKKIKVKDRLDKNTRKKNLVMLALILGWIALIWAITMIRTSTGNG